jgi:MoaA/NifB/PqqE/SkfB family radical SAM enzyme
MMSHGNCIPLKQLVIKPTLYCYHQCPYCDLRQDYYRDMLNSAKTQSQSFSNENLTPQKAGYIPLDLALKTIDEASKLGMTSLQLSGGDPLLYPHLIELITAGANCPGVFVFMNSVGTGITIEKAKDIIQAGLGAWNFSVDTLNPNIYDSLRGTKNGLLKILQAIKIVKMAASSWPDFCINYMTVITKQNYLDLPELLIHCIDSEVASIYLMNVYGDKTGTSLLDEKDIQRFRQDIVPAMLTILDKKCLPDVVQNNAANVLATFFSPDNSDSNYAKGIYWSDLAAAKQACRVPEYYALIEPNAKVLPCCLVEISHEGEVGSVTKSTLSEVWNGKDYMNFRQNRIPFCQTCSAPRHKTLGLIPKMCRQFNG